jgi:hypothetical protein
LLQDVLNLHLIEMKVDGTMELLTKKHQQKTQDIDCEAIDAAADAAADSSQLSFKEMAGPFLVHLIATGMALVVAAVSVFRGPIKQKYPEPEDDDSAISNVDESDDDDESNSGLLMISPREEDRRANRRASRLSMLSQGTELRGIRQSESGLVMINVDEPPREEDRRANRRASRLSMLPQGTELRGIRQTQKGARRKAGCNSTNSKGTRRKSGCNDGTTSFYNSRTEKHAGCSLLLSKLSSFGEDLSPRKTCHLCS